jgi:hypothetical protein
MLYIPPCWWHEVGAISTSISVNAWSYTADTQLVEQIMELTRHAVTSSLSGGGSWTPELKRQIGYWLLRQVAERVLTNRSGDVPPLNDIKKENQSWLDQSPISLTTASWLSQHIITERFADLLHRGLVPNHACYSSIQWWGQPPADAREPRATRSSCPASITTGVALSTIKKFRPTVTKIVATFQKLPLDGQYLWLANYLENMSYWATSSTNLIAILVQCAICQANGWL